MNDVINEELINILNTFLRVTSKDGGWSKEIDFAETLLTILEEAHKFN